MPFEYRILGDSPRNLVELLIERAELRPEKRLFTFLAEGESEQVHLCFAELDQRARTITAHLGECGWAGQPALLLCPPELEFIAAFCGCLYAGVIAVPCYPPRFNRPQPRLAGIVRDARPAAILTIAAMERQAERLSPHLPAIAALPWLATDAQRSAADRVVRSRRPGSAPGGPGLGAPRAGAGQLRAAAVGTAAADRRSRLPPAVPAGTGGGDLGDRSQRGQGVLATSAGDGARL